MSYTESSTQYNFSLGVGNDVWEQSFAPEFSGANMTDSLAVAFAKAWLGLPWPVGTNVTASVTKRESTDITTTGDLATGTFS